MRSVAIGDRIHPFRVVESAPGGGWIAERTQDFQQRVLIEIASEAVSDSVKRRIRERIRQLATLRHPCIPGLLQTGTIDDERPFATFELGDGLPLRKLACEKRLAIREQARLALECVKALSTAHRQLVAHGALNGDGFLIDDAGHPRLPVFLLDDSRPDPVRDDMRQMGEFLNEMFSSSSDRLPADLKTIVGRCQGDRRNPSYESCEALAEDLTRFLDYRPISGVSRNRFHSLAQFARRKPGIFYPVSISAAALLFALSWSLWLAQVAHRRQMEAESRLHDLHQLTASLESDLYQSVRRIPNSTAAGGLPLRLSARSKACTSESTSRRRFSFPAVCSAMKPARDAEGNATAL
ncbi:MAG TPA: hypothetical protein VMU71_08345 [Terracidiphilus sp.]|nr:hypothetical protein [Terracidiphilus sp.]